MISYSKNGEGTNYGVHITSCARSTSIPSSTSDCFFSFINSRCCRETAECLKTASLQHLYGINSSTSFAQCYILHSRSFAAPARHDDWTSPMELRNPWAPVQRLILQPDALLPAQQAPAFAQSHRTSGALLRLKSIHRRLGLGLPQRDKKLSVVEPRRVPAPP